MSDELGKVKCGQRAGRHSSGVAIAIEGDHRNSHPHRLARGRVTIPRKCIQSDIHLCVVVQMPQAALHAGQIEPLG